MTALPESYLRYVRQAGLKQGCLAVGPGWFRLWAPEEAERQNRSHAVQDRAPGFVGFGASGSGEIFAFDPSRRVVLLPLIGMSDQNAKIIAESWLRFVQLIEESNPSAKRSFVVAARQDEPSFSTPPA
jgi:hypothetical protein